MFAFLFLFLFFIVMPRQAPCKTTRARQDRGGSYGITRSAVTHNVALRDLLTAACVAPAVSSAQSSWYFPLKKSDISQEEQRSNSSAEWVAEEVRSVNLSEGRERPRMTGLPVASAKHCRGQF